MAHENRNTHCRRAPEVPQAFGALRKLTGLFFLSHLMLGMEARTSCIPYHGAAPRHQGVLVAPWFSFHLHDIGYGSASAVVQLEVHPELCCYLPLLSLEKGLSSALWTCWVDMVGTRVSFQRLPYCYAPDMVSQDTKVVPL